MADPSTSPHGVPPGSTPPATGRRKAPGRGRRALKISLWVLTVLVLLAGAGLGYAYSRLIGNLKRVDISTTLGTQRPRNVDDGSQDILVLGSDSRGGANGKYGNARAGARSDTAMLVHVYQGRRTATVVSIPRDTLVSRPACRRSDGGGTAPAARRVMFNASYQIGGPACTVKTVEAMSGIRMDHYLEVDFTGFTRLVDKLGGVEVTTSKPIKDRDSHLSLAPGTHILTGEQSLGLVRTRHAVGDGSDLGRIQLQQAFLRALLHRIQDIDLFDDPRKLYGLADTATRSVTTDSELAGVNKLLGFAGGLRGLQSRNIGMLTLPVRYDAVDPYRVVPLDQQSRQVWDALRHDRPVPPSATSGTVSGPTAASGLVKSP